MSYLDDTTEMFLKDNFTLKNDGNANTEFSISQTSDHFTIKPSKGIVEPGSSLEVCLTYNNCALQTVLMAGDYGTAKPTPGIKNTVSPLQSQNFTDERISVDIKNGINMSIRATFNPNIT